MAPSQITRITWTDDSGGGTDGTIIDNARKNSDIYAKIDEMFAGAGSYATFTFGGLVAAEGFGNHEFSAGGSGTNAMRVRNTQDGTANYSGFVVGNNLSAAVGSVLATADGFSGADYNGVYPRDGMMIKADRQGGLSIVGTDASGTIRISTNSTERLRVNASGKVLIVHGGATHDGNYGYLTITGPGTNFGQQLSLIRSGARVWSLGYVYNSSNFALGNGQSTDSNFTAANASLIVTTNDQVQVRSGSASTPSLAFADDPNTGIYRVGTDALGIARNGSLIVQFGDTTDPNFNQVIIPNTATGAAGANLVIGCNTSGSPAPGVLTLRDKSNTARYLWFDSTGVLRHGTTFPNSVTGDTIGSPV